MKRAALLLVLLLPATAGALSPEAAVTAALTDLDKQAKEDQPFLRYLFLPDGAAVQSIPDFTVALRLHVNLISREASLAYPRQIAPGLWRVDFRDYGWSRDVWESLARVDPYFHRVQVAEVVVKRVVTEEYDQPYGYYCPDGRWVTTYTQRQTRERVVREKVRKRSRQLYVPQGAGQLASLALLAESDQPVARADWFLVQGARQISLTNRETGVGYYDWLQLRDRNDFFKLIGLDRRAADRTQIRAVVGDSGVTSQNRQVVRDGATNGGHWQTLEVEDQSGRGVAIQELRDGELLHVAEEHYGFLLNGLPVTFLSDQKGVRQDTVPDKVAGNRSSLNTGNDTRVHVNLACMQCHEGRVLQPFVDDVRATYTGRLSVLTNDKNVQLELSRQYGADMDRHLERDRTLFQSALTQATGKSPSDAAKLYSQAFTTYAYGRVSLQEAAAELGVPAKALRKALQDGATRLGRGDFRFDPFLLDTPGRIPRLSFEDGFQDLQDVLYGVLNQNPSVDDGGVGGGEGGGAAIRRPKRRPEPETDR